MNSFTVICDNCNSKDVTVTADTNFMIHIECKNCGLYGVEGEDLIVNTQ